MGSRYQPKIYRDNGSGVTEESLRFWRNVKRKVGKVKLLICEEKWDEENRSWREYNTRIVGENGEVWLSGLNCGYGGEGPHGLLRLLVELGVPMGDARKLMMSRKVVVVLDEKP